MEGKIPMAARRHVTNKLRTAYVQAGKSDKTRILNEVMATTGLARSSARRMLTGGVLPDPREQLDRRRLRPKGYGDDSRLLLELVWALMGFPCGKYVVVMLGMWLPRMVAAGDLDRPFATKKAIAELGAMSAATIDRYLEPARVSMCLRGVSTTTPSPLLRNSIGLSKAGDAPATTPGVIEADTVAHCGPTSVGEFVRTLTMTDMVTGWTENYSIRNNASKWIVHAAGELEGRFPFPLRVFDSDNGSEFINHNVAAWLQQHDIAQTRSRPYRKNDQATVESKNNHVVRKHAFYWRYDTSTELDLLNELWALVSLRLNFFTPTKKPTGYTTAANGRRTRVYDQPQTPWQRVRSSGLLTKKNMSHVEQRIVDVNPADLTRRITTIQTELTVLARNKTQAAVAARHLDMASLKSSIERLNPTQ